MSQLLLIKTSSAVANIGDIVGVFDDNHVFTKHEKEIFNIVKVQGIPKAAVESMRPVIVDMVRAKSTEWVLDQDLERKQAWKDGEVYKEVAVMPKYPLSYKDGLFVNNYAKYSLNYTVLTTAAGTKEPITMEKG